VSNCGVLLFRTVAEVEYFEMEGDAMTLAACLELYQIVLKPAESESSDGGCY